MVLCGFQGDARCIWGAVNTSGLDAWAFGPFSLAPKIEKAQVGKTVHRVSQCGADQANSQLVSERCGGAEQANSELDIHRFLC